MKRMRKGLEGSFALRVCVVVSLCVCVCVGCLWLGTDFARFQEHKSRDFRRCAAVLPPASPPPARLTLSSAAHVPTSDARARTVQHLLRHGIACDVLHDASEARPPCWPVLGALILSVLATINDTTHSQLRDVWCDLVRLRAACISCMACRQQGAVPSGRVGVDRGAGRRVTEASNRVPGEYSLERVQQ